MIRKINKEYFLVNEKEKNPVAIPKNNDGILITKKNKIPSNIGHFEKKKLDIKPIRNGNDKALRNNILFCVSKSEKFLKLLFLSLMIAINPAVRKSKIPLMAANSYPIVFVNGKFIKKRLTIINARIKNRGRSK